MIWIAVLEKYDQRKCTEAKKEYESNLEHLASYKQAYTKRVATHRDALAAKTKGGSSGSKAFVPKALPAHIDQKEARVFRPPGSYIWLATRGEWCGHVAPYSRLSHPFAKHGTSQLALRACLKEMWTQYLEKSGLPNSACPYAGLL